jgi:hypothetical protein
MGKNPDMIFKLKEGVRIEDLYHLSPALWQIFAYVLAYAHNNNLPLVITSLINDRDLVNAISNTHAEGRAFDISIKDWPMLHIQRLCHQVNQKFKDIAAISKESGRATAAIDKPHGNGPHIHFQVRAFAPVHQFLIV